MTGRVFDKPIVAGEDVPASLIPWLENVDNAGRDLSTFARGIFEDGVSGSGISWIMVDAPPRSGTISKADVQRQNLRPYLVHLRPEDILGWKTETVNNVTAVTQLRIAETVKEPGEDEFDQVEVEQIRVLDVTESGVQVRIFRKADAKNEFKWMLYNDPYFTGLSEITVVPFYANRGGFWDAKPLLDDLADVNIAHWQSQSDQRNILHFARVPILFAKGIPADQKITISAASATVATDTDASLSWVEHSGSAIGAGRQDLKDLEFQMEAHGLQLLVNQAGGQSATGAALDAARETSILAMTADALKDALETALQFMADYAGEVSGGSVVVNKDFGAGTMAAQELQLLLSAVNTGNMSRETFINTLVNRGVIAESVTPADEAQRIEDEGGALMGMTNGGQ